MINFNSILILFSFIVFVGLQPMNNPYVSGNNNTPSKGATPSNGQSDYVKKLLKQKAEELEKQYLELLSRKETNRDNTSENKPIENSKNSNPGVETQMSFLQSKLENINKLLGANNENANMSAKNFWG